MKTTSRQPKRNKTSRQPPPGKRAENKERTKQAILKAALDSFSTQGFRRTTAREIARKAGIAEGALSSYFRTKEDLALYFFETELVELVQWYEEQTRLQTSPLAEKLFAIVNHQLERLAPYEEFIGVVYVRALQPASKLSPLSLEKRELSLRYLRFLQEILVEAQDREEIPKVGQIGVYVVGLFHVAMITYWLNDRSRGKENTLAMLDRCLKWAHSILTQKGGWDW